MKPIDRAERLRHVYLVGRAARPGPFPKDDLYDAYGELCELEEDYGHAQAILGSIERRIDLNNDLLEGLMAIENEGNDTPRWDFDAVPRTPGNH